MDEMSLDANSSLDQAGGACRHWMKQKIPLNSNQYPSVMNRI